MLNVQALTSTLSAMSLPQLQQYASLHKNDPYVVTMALSIANQKKQMQTAAQGQAGQQPMPKVVDQQLAEMAPRQAPMPQAAPMPEEVGIGQLPAPNIAKMAGGGIVAFGDGGEIPRYRDEGLVRGQYYIDPITGEKVPVKTSSGLFDEEKLRRLKEAGGELWDKYMGMFATPEEKATKAWQLKDTSTKPAQAAVPAAAPDQSDAETNRLLAVRPPETPATTPRNTNLPTVNPPTVKPPVAAPAAGLPNLITDAAGMQKALGEMQKGLKPQVPDAISQGIKDLQTAEEAAANKNVADIEAEQKARAPALKEFEARVKEKEGRLTKQEEMQGPMALLQAGFAIMGGTSPFALANIGAGAQVGLKAYADGAEKLEAARDKIAESYGKIEEVRRNESRMDSKELREARNAALKPAIEAKKLTMNALTEDWKLSRQDATKGLEAIMANQREMFAQGEATKRARIQASASDPLSLYRALGRGDADITKGLEVATKLKTEPKSEQDFRQDWAKSLVLQQRYPDVNDFVRMMKGTAALQSGAQLNASDAALINKYLKP